MFYTTKASREAVSSYNSWLVPAWEGREICLPFIVHISACQRLLFAGNGGCLRPEALAAALEFVTSSIVCCGMLIPRRAGELGRGEDPGRRRRSCHANDRQALAGTSRTQRRRRR